MDMSEAACAVRVLWDSASDLYVGGSIFSRLLLKCANELHEKFSVFSRKENTENLKT